MLFFYLLSAIQIFFETFPVSSSGHVELAKKIFSFQPSSDYFFDKWLYVLHVPTAIIVAFFFYSVWSKPFIKKKWWLVVRSLWLIFIVDFITFLFFFIHHIYHISLSFPLSVSFFSTMIILFSLYFVPVYRSTFTEKKALYVGLAQGILFLLPGLSRFATVYALLRWSGITSQKSFAICWMVQWPLMVGAGIYGVFVLQKNSALHCYLTLQGNIVIALASCASLVGMYFVFWIVKRKFLWLFAFYMILPLILSLVY